MAHPSGSESEKSQHVDKTLDYIRAVPGLSELKLGGRNVFTCPALNPTLTIDYIFHGPGLVALSGEVQAQEEPPSDHLPVIGRFKVV